jgi:colanic acid/amylovoran biosynthesis glycosyltransferase
MVANAPVKLLLVTGRFPAWSETFIYRKAVGLAIRGHDVTLATRRIGDWHAYPAALPPGLHVEALPPDDSLRDPRNLIPAALATTRQVLKRGPKAARLLRACNELGTRERAVRLFLKHAPFLDREADVMHFEFLSLGAMYPAISAATDRPIVVSCRGNDVHTLELQSPVLREAAIKCVRSAAAVHCVSDEMAREVTRLTGRTEGLWVNRPAVDVSAITPRPNERGKRLRILATGRLVWKKGFDYLLTAFARMASAGVDFEADIIGEGPLRSVMRFSIADLGLDSRVRLRGAVSSSEVLAKLQATDVFVLSSVEEGISNAALEAMASGVPVVTTTAGGMAEAVSDGVEGFVVPVRDADALANRLGYLANDENLRAKLADAARRRAVSQFSLERQMNVFEEMYRSVMAGTR